MSRRGISVTGLLVVLLFVSASYGFAGGGKEAVGQATINFWKAPHGDDEQIFGYLINEFQTQNPGIKISHLVTPWNGWDEKYGAAYAGGNPPDIAYMPDEFYPKFAQAGEIIALDTVGDMEAMRKLYPSSFWSKGHYMGSQYGMTTLAAPFLIYYRTDIFAEVGAQPPTTWQEFRAAIEKTATKDRYGFYFATIESFPWNRWYNFLFQAGADLLNKDLTKVGFDNQAGVTATQFTVDMFGSDAVPNVGLYTFDQVAFELFPQGKLAMMCQGPDIVPAFQQQFPDLEYGIIPPLIGPGGKERQLTWTPTGMWVISTASKYKEASWKFVEFLMENEGYYSKRLGLLACTYKGQETAFAGSPKMEIYQRDPSWYYVTPLHPKLRQIHQILWSEVESAIIGEQSAAQAIRNASDNANRILAE
jgi:multiple sugar transport system substrate-binding protein